VATNSQSSRSRLPIASLHPFAQKGFEGYESLNPVQSIVYPTVFETNENILVCAPTGAGKTDIAMLSILRCIHQHTNENNQIAKSDFKIVYIAPMKALAAEVTQKFSKRLGVLNLKVKELTGDMQLTKAEIVESQMLVLTPEKFDVVGRKSIGDTELMQKVRLLIIDEVHLLNEDRGSVIETIVARTQRLVESSQMLIRIVGLSATLPNYIDVSSFLGVNPYQGLFFFDSSYRPIPLEQNFIGVKAKAGSIAYRSKLNEICFDKVSVLRKENRQAMIFVHSRKDTVKTAQDLRQEALMRGLISDLSIKEDPLYGIYVKEVQKSRNKELKELFEYGMGIHHAGTFLK
jgi:replicative superfamily II helicase